MVAVATDNALTLDMFALGNLARTYIALGRRACSNTPPAMAPNSWPRSSTLTISSASTISAPTRSATKSSSRSPACSPRPPTKAGRTPLRPARDPWQPITGEVPVTVSIGVSAAEADGTQSSLLARADKWLYTAKDQGRNRVCTDPETIHTERRRYRAERP